MNETMRLVREMNEQSRNYFLEDYLNSKEFKNKKIKNSDENSLDSDKITGNIMIVIKEYNPDTQEKGVLILQYTDLFKEIFTIREASYIFKRYYIVLEPSSCGYCNPDILMFINTVTAVIVECSEADDYNFIQSLNSNLAPVSLGSSHWIDLNEFRPLENIKKEFDVIFVANWALCKYHFELFRVLKRLKNSGLVLKVLLIGFSWPEEPRKREDIERDIQNYKIEDMVTVIEHIPTEKVNEYLNKSRVSILLSRKEGSCRATTEALAAGIPILIYKFNKGGSVNFVNHETGELADYAEMADIIFQMIDSLSRYRPRQWAEKNIGSQYATDLLNTKVKEVASLRGEEWTLDIKEKVNSRGMRLKETGEYWVGNL